MIRRIAVVAVLVGAGLAVAPAAASAEPLCETVGYSNGPTIGPDCFPYPLATECSGGHIPLGTLGYLTDDICLPTT